MVYFSVYEESLKCLITAAGGLAIADYVIIDGIFQRVRGKSEVPHYGAGGLTIADYVIIDGIFQHVKESLKCLIMAAGGLTIANCVIIDSIFQCVRGKSEVPRFGSRRFNHS